MAMSLSCFSCSYLRQGDFNGKCEWPVITDEWHEHCKHKQRPVCTLHQHHSRVQCGQLLTHSQLPYVNCAGLVWQGRAHSGIDDATNTANLAIKLMGEGVQFDITQTSENPLVQSPPKQQQGSQLGLQGRFGSKQIPPNATSAAAAASGKEGATPSVEEDTGLGHLAAAAVTNDAAPSQHATSQLTPGKGRPSMAQRAACNGVTGVFDASGRWLGRCFCGVKAKHRVTKRPGANHGRAFWSCGSWKITGAGQDCGFFLWADERGGGC